MVKHFSSMIANRKKYDSALCNDRCLPTNQLEKDHNGTRIVAKCKLLKSAMRTNTGTFVFCNQFNTPQILTEEEWKTVGEFKVILRDICVQLLHVRTNKK